MDFSEKSSSTPRYVQAIAHRYGAKLVPVQVIAPVGDAFPEGMDRSISTDQAAGEELKQIEEPCVATGACRHT